MPMVLDTLSIVLMAVLRVFSLYFFIVALFCLKRPKRFRVAEAKTRFACLVAARNEEAVIGQLVESLRRQDYPDELYDIYVIPNNCTDGTEEAASKAGARIFRCMDPVRCKGDALHQAVAWLLPQGYDAFCVFDADNVVDGQFLSRMNDAFCGGAKVAKASLRVKNPGDSWVSGWYGLYFTLFDTFYSRARANCGLSAKLVGTGFVVHRDVLERLGGWNTKTIAEDAEFSAQCAALGVRIHYIPDAVTYDEAPTTLSVSLRQRRRWCSGVMTVAEQRVGTLFPVLGRRGGLRAFDMLVFLITPFTQALSWLPLVIAVPAAALDGELSRFALIMGGGLALGWIGLTLFGAVLAKVGGYGAKVVKSVLTFPIFMASWLPLQILSLVRRTREWKIINHTRGLSVGEVTR